MAVTKPTSYLNWTDGDPSKVVQPPNAQLFSGWTEGEAPPFEYMNWLFWNADQWIKYLNESINGTLEADELKLGMRLINGGFWSWDLGTDTLAWTLPFNLAIPSIVDADNQAGTGNIVILDGQMAYVEANIPFIAQADTQIGSNVLNNLSFTLGITVGMMIEGPGIPPGTLVSTISGNQIGMTANATLNATQAVIEFVSTGALTVLVANTEDLVPTLSTVVIARRIGSVIFLGVNTGQMSLHDGESKPLLDVGGGFFEDNAISGTIDGVNAVFVLNKTPASPDSLFFFVDENVMEQTDYSLSGATVTITNPTFIPSPGQTIFAKILMGSVGGGGGGASSALVTYGTVGSPNTIINVVGVPSTADQRALRYVQSAGGVVPITATPQIAAGTLTSQELVLKGGSNTNYIQLADGNGLSLNGPINLTLNATLYLFWNGVVWDEISRR